MQAGARQPFGRVGAGVPITNIRHGPLPSNGRSLELSVEAIIELANGGRSNFSAPRFAGPTLERSAEFPALPGPAFGGNPGLQHDRLAALEFPTMPVPGFSVQRLAVEIHAVRMSVQPVLGLLRGPGFLLGSFQRLLFGPRLQAQPFGPRFGAGLFALLFTCRAFAADRLQVGFEVIGAVVVVDLFARLDVLDRTDHDLALARLDVGLRIRLAGVVDVAGDILADRAVDGPAAAEFEQILVLDRVVLLVARIQQRPDIADDLGALLDRFGGKEAESGAGTADTVRFIR